MSTQAALAAILALSLPGFAVAQPPALAPDSPLIEDEGWELVYANCSACHSLRLVASQRADRDTWLRLIRWMQATQNLWDIAPAVEDRILDYLADNYAPEPWTRRAPLPAHLRP